MPDPVRLRPRLPIWPMSRNGAGHGNAISSGRWSSSGVAPASVARFGVGVLVRPQCPCRLLWFSRPSIRSARPLPCRRASVRPRLLAPQGRRQVCSSAGRATRRLSPVVFPGGQGSRRHAPSCRNQRYLFPGAAGCSAVARAAANPGRAGPRLGVISGRLQASGRSGRAVDGFSSWRRRSGRGSAEARRRRCRQDRGRICEGVGALGTATAVPPDGTRRRAVRRQRLRRAAIRPRRRPVRWRPWVRAAVQRLQVPDLLDAGGATTSPAIAWAASSKARSPSDSLLRSILPSLVRTSSMVPEVTVDRLE